MPTPDLHGSLSFRHSSRRSSSFSSRGGRRRSGRVLAILATASMVASLGLLTACKEEKGSFGESQQPKSNVEKQRAKEEKSGENQTPPDFSKALKVEHSYDAASKKIVAKLSIQQGFHAYAPGNEIGVPVDIAIKEAGGWKLGEKTIPAGVEKDMGELGVAKMLEGEVELSAAVSGGKGKVSGQTMVQICTENVCDRPRQHAFALDVPEA